MIKVTNSEIYPRINSQGKAKDRQIVWGIVIVLLAAFSAIVSSTLGLGLLAFWPLVILFFIFMRYYELGLICFVLSFAYQAPVIFAPSFGLSAVIRLDEMIFLSIFPIWLLRNVVRQEKRLPRPPLRNLLLFYALIAFLSLLVRYNQISSTPFIQSAIGIKGLVPLILRLFEVVGGYLILTDHRTTQRTRKNLFWGLPIVAAFAVVFGFFASFGFLPKDFFGREMYDPSSWYTRFSLYGNTSAWGVLLMIYFFILLYWCFYLKSAVSKATLFILMIMCIATVFISGTKTAMVCIIIGLILLMLKELRNFNRMSKIMIIGLLVTGSGFLILEQLATPEQKKEVYSQFENIHIVTRGFESVDEKTSFEYRFDSLIKFREAVKEEPVLLILGRGWHRRLVYETGNALHDDLLTAIHDMGIWGGVFVIWLYFSMFRQFMIKKNQLVSTKETNFLRSIMQILVLSIILSSFMSENLTLYWGIDVQFPLIIMIMAVVWNYMNNVRERVPNAFL